MRFFVGCAIALLAGVMIACDATRDRADIERNNPEIVGTLATSGPLNTPAREDTLTVSSTPVLPIQSYFEQVLATILSSTEATESALTMLESPQLDDSAWRQQLRETVAPLQTADAVLQEVTPPTCLQQAHADLRQAMEAMGQAAEFLPVLFATQSVGDLEATEHLLEMGLDHVRDATQAMRNADC